MFLHRILKENSPLKSHAEVTLQSLRKRYNESEKIVAPHSVDELREVLIGWHC